MRTIYYNPTSYKSNQKPKKVERCKKVNLKPFFPIMLSLFESCDAFEVNQPIFLEEEKKRKQKKTKFATTTLICTTYLLLLYLKKQNGKQEIILLPTESLEFKIMQQENQI